MWDLNCSPDHNDDGADTQQFCFPVLEMGPTPGAVAGSVAAELIASSSSSSSARCCKYDVFLSFRGPDTRRGITSQLYDQLHNKRRVATFMDDRDLEVGDAISPTLLKAIEESRFAIVVLSPNYASSTWCLEELAKICECMKDQKRILPLFYNVEPTNVRFQKRSFEEAFNVHESSGRHRSEKVQLWKDALSKVTSFSGWDSNKYKTDTELVEKIVDTVFKRIQPFDVEFTMSTGDFEAYEETRKSMGEVMKALIDDNVTAIGVYGMGGVGKTTLVKHVAAQTCKNGIFHHVVMAVVSQSPNIERIQHTLLAKLQGPDFQLQESERASRLYKEIMRKTNVLIILDDVWGFIDLLQIGIPSYDELKKRNSKVLLTSRSRHVCHSMGSKENIYLDFLSEPDSWSLFVKKTRRSFDTPDFDSVARKVARECRGLPIALIAVARALGDKDLAEWQTAAQQLKKSRKANPHHDDTAFQCLKLSYDSLKNKDYESCFLLCCLFPEDYDISIEDLFKYAIGKGLFRDDIIHEARAIADTVVKHLIDASLLLDGEYDGDVRMHDVVRDTAMRIAKCEDGHGFLVSAGCGLKDWPCRSHEDYHAISLMANNLRSLPDELICPKLQILLLQANRNLYEIPETFFQSQNELKVLDLSRTNISLLPQSFSLLTKLQALHLDCCRKAVDISIVGKLKKLEILSMRQYPLTELSREIGNLTNLRMLDIGGYCFTCRGIVTIPSEVISKLHRLEELYMMNCGFVNWESPIEGEGDEINIGFGELAGLSKLKILQVSLPNAKCIPKDVEVEPDWIYFDIHIGCPCEEDYQYDRKSRSLRFGDRTISTLPDWFIKAVTEKTEKLEYDRCEGMSDIVMEYDQMRLGKLKHLRVRGGAFVFLKELMNTKTRRVETRPVFENLEELHLIELIHLEELCVGELPPGSLFNLKVFHVYFGNYLKSVSEFVRRLPNLEKLYLNVLGEMEYVFGCEGCEPEQSKLSEMHLLSLEALRSICNGPAPRAMFRSLKTLIVYDCKLLQSLFASDVAECLVQLEDLFVEGCPLLERVMEAVNKDKTVLPNLKNLVLKNLPMLYGPSATTVDIECPSLERLVVVDCPQLPFSTSSDLFEDLESRNQFSFSTSASDYFGSRNPVQLNDPQLYEFLCRRCENVTPSYEEIYEVMKSVDGEHMKWFC
ncbi:PREDICTED: disease resistance protein At4g27190-like [Fragaria vesca subsp. vesca]|uniref:probable disease resistance protein At4g27220 n=1 Tax=Fragaria vesca subsp. vesca TaxID=101020 RepID=UPI0002C3483E|nr:PREDICTED: probable disease resistance protein At4g27220 [Fragaria vesca subsp. vesca]XP_011470930.1 PREDICTED: probable disease resistance protein At4g27220 [Fragaria vesca subsp. vesca]XP_011470931.1 PREDICTED: probable disease resistance protein At4g27220 [Fragaria vesca subsp. vesca]